MLLQWTLREISSFPNLKSLLPDFELKLQRAYEELLKTYQQITGKETVSAKHGCHASAFNESAPEAQGVASPQPKKRKKNDSGSETAAEPSSEFKQN